MEHFILWLLKASLLSVSAFGICYTSRMNANLFSSSNSDPSNFFYFLSGGKCISSFRLRKIVARPLGSCFRMFGDSAKLFLWVQKGRRAGGGPDSEGHTARIISWNNSANEHEQCARETILHCAYGSNKITPWRYSRKKEHKIPMRK